MKDKVRAVMLVIGYMLVTVLSGCSLTVDGQPVDTGGSIALGSGEMIVLGMFVIAIFALARKD